MGLTFNELAAFSPVVNGAAVFATCKHIDQVRKYTNEPYINHPFEVARMILSVISPGEREAFIDVNTFSGSYLETMVTAALLHDVVEDCGVSLEEIGSMFSPRIMMIVDGLTNKFDDPALGNRHERKIKEAERLVAASFDVRLIKAFDIIDNIRSIVKHDLDFAGIYLQEKQYLIDKGFLDGLPYHVIGYVRDFVDKACFEISVHHLGFRLS